MDELKAFCILIGCSGMCSKCPGDPDCSIIRKVFKPAPQEDKKDG